MKLNDMLLTDDEARKVWQAEMSSATPSTTILGLRKAQNAKTFYTLIEEARFQASYDPDDIPFAILGWLEVEAGKANVERPESISSGSGVERPTR